MTSDGRVYKFDQGARGQILVPKDNELDNGSTTDTLQWCVLHHGHCHDVVPIRRHFDNPNCKDEIFLACQRCVRALRKAGFVTDSKYAGLPCVEVVVPRGLYTPDLKRSDRQQGKPTTSPPRSGQVAYEVTLDPLQVKYLRALGLQVIPEVNC